MDKLTLGTAQLGMNYGINNFDGQPKIKEAFSILTMAYTNNIRTFDSAPAYGNSESIIGSWKNHSNFFNIFHISKLHSLNKLNIEIKNLESVIRSLINKIFFDLKITKLDTLLIHDFKDVYLYGHKLFNILRKIQDEGLISRYGCSIYDLHELEYLHNYEIGALQIPGNIFNNRILNNPILSLFKNKGVKVYVRSVFLQGLFFIKEENIPPNLTPIKPYLFKLNELLVKRSLTITEGTLNYVRNNPFIDSVVIGVDSVAHLNEIINTKQYKQLDNNDILNEFSNIPSYLYDPRKWR
jgi:aryl-alcohol dehydrogenase-like predicted oxidoreductase